MPGRRYHHARARPPQHGTLRLRMCTYAPPSASSATTATTSALLALLIALFSPLPRSPARLPLSRPFLLSRLGTSLLGGRARAVPARPRAVRLQQPPLRPPKGPQVMTGAAAMLLRLVAHHAAAADRPPCCCGWSSATTMLRLVRPVRYDDGAALLVVLHVAAWRPVATCEELAPRSSGASGAADCCALWERRGF